MVGEPKPIARCAVAASVAALFLGLPIPSRAQTDPAVPPGAVVLSAVRQLRSEVVSDHLRAIRALGSAEIELRVTEWDQSVWEGVDARIGWSYFFGTSPAVLAAAASDSPITAFYQPWTDVALVVEWSLVGDQALIRDIELVDGVVVRSPDAPAPGPEPGWAGAQEFAPLAVARQTAAFIQAFERLYPEDFRGDWRSRLPVLVDPGFMELNRAAVALRLGRGIAMLAALRAPADHQPPEMARLLSAADRLRNSDVEVLLAEAATTTAESEHALRQAPSGALASLATVAAIPGESSGVVFLAPRDSPDFFAGLWVRDGGTGERIERIDFVTYRGLAQAFPAGDAR